jgi:pilus assembly protein CpaB
VTTRLRRRRALLFLALALASGGLAATQVSRRVRDVEARVGPLVPVVVTTRAVRPDEELGGDRLAVRPVPERFAPADAVTALSEARGLRAGVALPPGSYLTEAELRGAHGDTDRSPLRRGERAVEVSVSGGQALTESATPGARVDVLVSKEHGGGGGRSFLALEDVELLGLRSGASGAGGNERSDAVATLRVTLGQGVYLTAAQNFAREVRLLLRPPGDGARNGRAAVEASGL